MHYLPMDLRLALRTFARNRSFAATAIAALALGIGANSAIFSVIYGVLLKPLPYRDPGRLVRVYENNSRRASRMPFPCRLPISSITARQNRVFESIATYVRQDQQYGGERPRAPHRHARLARVFPSARRRAAYWAAPSRRRKNPTRGPTDIVIVSHNVWQRLLGGSPHAIGTTIRLTDSPFRIVGVMPPGFEQLSGGRRLPRGEAVDVWLPFNHAGQSRESRALPTTAIPSPGSRPAPRIEQAQAEMNAIAAGLEAQYPDDKNWRIQLKPLQDDLVGKARPTLLILAGAVGFVLLIACVNVANLLLARSTRAAAGDGDPGRGWRDARPAGAATAHRERDAGGVGRRARPADCLVGRSRPGRARTRTTAARSGHRAGCARGPGDRCGLRLRAGCSSDWRPRWPPEPILRRGSPRGVFVVAEVALTFVLLIGAGLLLRSFVAIGRVDPGFHPHGVLTMNTALSVPKLVGARRYAAFYERFVEELARLPGVSAAGAASNLPWTGANDNALFGIEGRPGPPA